MQSELARQKNAAAPADPARIKALEAELEKSRTEFMRQKQDISRLETDVTGYKEKVSKLELRPEALKQQAPRQLVAMTPPSIQIIDPQIVLTRDTATVKVRSGVGARSICTRDMVVTLRFDATEPCTDLSTCAAGGPSYKGLDLT